MADRIVVSTDMLEKWAGDLGQIQSAIAEAAKVLSSVPTTKDAGGELKISMDASLTNGARISGGTVKAVLQSMNGAMGRTAADAQAVQRGVMQSAYLFSEAETEAKQTIGAIESTARSTTYMEETSSSALNRRLPSIKELIKRLKERKERLIPEADRLRVFDEDGQYGGDQGSPVYDTARYPLYRDIIEKNTGRRLESDEEVRTYLSRLNSEGCGYVTMANAIFRAYEGRSEEFKATFGFDMCRNGEFDYDRLLVDVYSKTDNHIKQKGKDVFNWNEDRLYDSERRDPFYDPYLDDSGRGVTADEAAYRTKLYLDSYGVKSTIKTYGAKTITVKNFEKYAAKGEVRIMTGSPFTLYTDPTSTRGETWPNGGHAMTVTGVENGRFVVSSWGQKYYLDPNDKYGFRTFQVVTIK